MRKVGGRILCGLLLVAAAQAEPAACSIKKGLYDEWLSLSRRANGHKGLKDSLLRTPAGGADPARQRAIGEEYQGYFRCLSEAPAKLDEKTAESFCDSAAGDRLGLLVCQAVRYVNTGRTVSKDFIDVFPAGRKGVELWDLDEILGAPGAGRLGVAFQPEGVTMKLIDELFLLVLDDKETAAATYFNISATATGAYAKHMDEQIKILLRDSPSVVVKQWPTLRQYRPAIRKLLAEMAASLPRAEMNRLRLGVAGFCKADNLDCLEILKVFGKPE